MTMYVFLGPSVSRAEARCTLDATYLPPAAQGELHRVALERPYAIGIIDGYFQRVPSVWHKEILWAMAQGIRVYGSASMGALRAAELASFGMTGVGWVFEAFSSGVLEDDDEVAVAHASEEHAYRASSEAMVNIRRTLTRAVQERVISERTGDGLTRLAKALHYADRSYPRVLCEGAEHGLNLCDLDELRAWLPVGAVNQKRDDALMMLRAMKADAEACRPPLEVRYTFEHTAPWEAARSSTVRTSANDPGRSATERPSQDEAVLEELKLSGHFAAARRSATGRALALEVARHVDRRMEGTLLHEAIAEFRDERGLRADADFERWLEAHEVSSLDFFKEEGLVRMVSRLYEQEALRLLPDQLRSSGEYGRLLERARNKEARLAAEDFAAAPALDDAELITWYFEKRMRRPVPSDLSGYLRAMGITSLSEFVSMLTREYLYSRTQVGN